MYGDGGCCGDNSENGLGAIKVFFLKQFDNEGMNEGKSSGGGIKICVR